MGVHRTCQDGRGVGKTRKNVRRNSAHPDAKPNGWFGSPMQPIGTRGGPKASPDTMKTPHCDRICLAIVPGWSCRRCRRAAELPKLRPSQLCAEGRCSQTIETHLRCERHHFQAVHQHSEHVCGARSLQPTHTGSTASALGAMPQPLLALIYSYYSCSRAPPTYT